MSENDSQDQLKIGQRLKAMRVQQRLTLRDLAKRVDLSASMLSQIETGKSFPSVRSMHTIAMALGVSIESFFPEQASTSPDTSMIEGMSASDMRHVSFNRVAADEEIETFWPAPSHLDVVHRHTRPTITLDGDVVWSRLTADAEIDAEFLEIAYPPGSSSGTNMAHHDGREFTLILEGELVVQLGFDQVTLYKGDSLVFDSHKPHRISNNSSTIARAVWVIRNRAT